MCPICTLCPKRIELKLAWGSNMASIEIEVDNLHNRTVNVQQLLTPLRGRLPVVACTICKKPSHGCKVVAAHDGAKDFENFEKWQFKTFARDILCQYYEFWKPINGHKILCLNRAYLNIFQTNRVTHTFDKVLSIHCDPYEEGDEPQTLYKQGPHLHVQKAEQPIPKCHFPLNLSELENILS